MIKDDWVECELGKICKINMGQSPPSSTYNNDNLGLPFFQGKAEFTDLYPIVKKWCSEPKKTAEKDDILLSVRAPVGATNIANQKCAIGRGLAAITYKYASKFIWYYLKSIEQYLDKQGTGTTFRAISGTVLKSQKILIPSLPEQRAIVAKIETLFSDLDKGIADLKTAQEQLKIYRQAVLKKAFEGELTKKWREKQTDLPTADELLEQIKKEREDHYNKQIEEWKKTVKKWEENGKEGKKPGKPKKLNEVENIVYKYKTDIPSCNWTIINFLDFVTLQRGYDLPLKNIIEGEHPVITSGGIAGYHNEYRANGPALITGRSGGVGNIHFLDVEYYWPHNTVLHVKDFKGNYPKYIYLFFLIFDFKSHSASTAVPTLDRKMLYKLPVKIPGIKEQHQIVQEIEARLSVCDKLEQTITESLEKSNSLRQSILKKAFAGKLLNKAELEKCKQDKNYEPASELLKKIKAEKTKQ
ncbi:restriction endonuclease subunit S [Candidatus Venteria ishoeyi]|uniref:restriction endonuclease subunit S n=1 Tax=Candidatus Venteria ishoeyi TaxID=1899563 RepID=UPI0025A67D9A|nr:restriction endonuclease subunit S [Candidatus Venteria ishoeyi]MDM8547217.1 restriction endonuclease subunit S [Candidatus Venteria ishoeyi]